MARSMTGYGKGECTLYNRKFSVEIKSVNHRFNEVSVKIPRILNCYEDKVKSRLSSEVSRGKVDVYINFESFSESDYLVEYDEALAASYVEILQKMKERFSLSDGPSLSLVARFPDVISVERGFDTEEVLLQMWETLEAALSTAVVNFVGMRTVEGEALKNDLFVKRAEALNLLDKIKNRVPDVARGYAERLKVKVMEALAGLNLDESRFIQEITYFADRSCVDEEITRLDSHLSQLGDILENENIVGKKLDFLIQEINREVNTIGSKSNDLTVTKYIVEMKSIVEKIREQVQNLE